MSHMFANAINFNDAHDCNLVMPISSRITAGESRVTLKKYSAARIFTGGIVPINADTVVPQELCELNGEKITINVVPKLGSNIRKQGQDIEVNKKVVEKGNLTTLNCAEEIFLAEKDQGSYLNNQRLRVSKKNFIDDCLFSSNHEGLKYSNLNMRCSGSAALDLAYVASGRLDGFFQNKINLWDVAAGALLIKEAGGIVNDIDKFDIKNIDIKASSDAINAKMLQKLENF